VEPFEVVLVAEAKGASNGVVVVGAALTMCVMSWSTLLCVTFSTQMKAGSKSTLVGLR
jgi:hypothetical protein